MGAWRRSSYVPADVRSDMQRNINHSDPTNSEQSLVFASDLSLSVSLFVGRGAGRRHGRATSEVDLELRADWVHETSK